MWPVSTFLTTKLRLQAGAGEGDVIHLPSGLDRANTKKKKKKSLGEFLSGLFSLASRLNPSERFIPI